MTKKKILITAVVSVLVLLIAGSGGYLLFKHLHMQNDAAGFQAAKASAQASDSAADSTAAAPTDESGVPLAPNPVNFAYWQKINPEIYSWITVPGTEVDYPVLQSETSDSFYLDHDYEKSYSFAGSIYSQFCNHKDYSDRVTVLYGHNMANNSMFASLHAFEDAGFFDAHSEMTVYTPDKRLDYEVVSAYIGDDSHIMNSFDFSKDAVYRAFLENVLSPHSINSNVRQGAKLDVSDRILILSTCLNYGEGRYLVVGKLMNETPLAPAAPSD